MRGFTYGYQDLDPAKPEHIDLIGRALRERIDFTLIDGMELDPELEEKLKGENERLAKKEVADMLASILEGIEPEVKHVAVVEPSLELPKVSINAEIITTSLGLYAFPENNREFVAELRKCESVPSEQLLKELESASVTGGYPRGTRDYFENRTRALAISFALNLRHRYPPALRPFWNVSADTPPSNFSREDTQMYNDIRMIDLHWLHCVGKTNRFRLEEADDIASFNFKTATSFVTERKKRDAKTEELSLATWETLSLKTLKPKRAAERHRVIMRQIAKIASCVREEKLNPSCRLKISEEQIRNAAISLLLTNGNLKGALSIYTQISGEQIVEQQLRRREKWLVEKGIISFSVDLGTKQSEV